jgi:predicted glycosyltransferase
VDVVLTARDFAQTLPLARTYGLDVHVIGGHTGSRRPAKVARMAARTAALARAMRRGWAQAEGGTGGVTGRARRIDLAVGHNSYAQVLAARWLGIPAVTLMDYEFQPANHLSFRLARRVIVPFTFPDAELRRCGASPSRTFRYQGLKEEVYLADFVPQPAFEESLRAALVPPLEPGFDLARGPLAVLRPPATFALYHGPENRLFDLAIERLAGFPETTVLVSPRTATQRERLLAARPPNVRVLDARVRGLDLLARADLVMSAGGTMNREAALLGTPTYTVLAARIGSADQWLIDQGRMVRLANEADLERVIPRRVGERPRAHPNRALPEEIVSLILGALDGAGIRQSEIRGEPHRP